MKDPNHTEDLIVSFIHQETTPAEKDAVQKRIDSEPDFQSLTKEYQALDGALRKIPKKQASDLMAERIMQNIAKANPKKSISYVQVLSWVAIAFLTFTVLWSYLTPRNDSQETKTSVVIATAAPLDKKATLAKAELGALDWLSQAQAPNGSWTGEDWGAESQYTIGLSGLSLLAFASADQSTHKASKENHLTTVKKASEYILSTQNKDGSFGPAINNRLYNQGIATVALFKVNEVFPGIIPVEALKKSIAYISSCQNSKGGWGYFNENETPNTSISIWQIHSLILAKQNGFSGLEDSIKTNLTWLQKMADKNGVIGYRKPSDFPYGQNALTAMSGIFWLYEEELSDNTLEFKIKFQEDLEKIALAPDKNLNYYQFYFLTSSLKKLKEKHQFELAQKVEDVLVAKQIKNGQMHGSWEPNDCWGPTGGRIYSTAMATISLVALK